MQGPAAVNDSDCRHMVVFPLTGLSDPKLLRRIPSRIQKNPEITKLVIIWTSSYVGSPSFLIPQDDIVPLGVEHWPNVKTGLERALVISWLRTDKAATAAAPKCWNYNIHIFGP